MSTLVDLVRRAHGEFMEMPGLRLDMRQAQRLFGLDSRRCEAVLEALVESGVLARAEGVYSLRRSHA